jgi:flavorubredoxin
MKFLYFETDADETSGVCVAADKVVGIDCAANDAIIVYFDDLGGANTHDGQVTLNVTAGKTKEVSEAIAEVLNSGGVGTFVTIADDSNSEYIHSDITSCGTIVLAA